MNAQAQVPAPENHRVPARPGDAAAKNWVEATPPFMRPYLRLMRLDRPIGAWLLYWPCVFGLILGAVAQGVRFPNFWYAVLCGLGAVVMRGAGCTYNDIVDRDFDAKVERTRGRPIPSGAVSAKAAWAFAAVLAFTGLLVLLAFNRYAIVLGASSLLLVAIYPFMKRITWWPQAWLGLTFNWGTLFGFAAAAGTLTPAAYLFYAGCVFWTVGYDIIYAHQDKEDDILVGVKSAAIRLGANSMPWLYGFYAVAIGFMLAGGFAAGLGVWFALAMLMPTAHMLWQLRGLNVDDPKLCLRLFKSNRDTGALIAGALLVGLVAGV